MDAPTAQPTCRIPSWLPLTLLIALGLSLRLWVIARTEVAARDSVGFIRYALRLEHEPWRDVIKTAEQPPGYPIVVMYISWPVRAWAGDTSCDMMVLSAQLASALMGVLSIIPMVLLGRELIDRRIGWMAAALFLCLPSWVRLTSDGLSEATYLFCLALTLWLGVRALRRPSAMRFLLCGFGAGCAYLTRPEGIELAVAIGLVLCGMQLFAPRRQPWARLTPQLAALAVGLLVFLTPYVAVTGRLTNKNTGKLMLGDPDVDRTGLTPGTAPQTRSGGGIPLALWWHEPTDAGRSRPLWAARALAAETVQGLNYVGAGLAVFGLVLLRPRAASRPGLWLVGLLIGLHALILLRMAVMIGYLSERHTLLFVLAGCFPAAAALLWLGDRLRTAGAARGVPFASMATAALVAALVTAELPVLRKPLHGNRAGHKAAGRWLAGHATPQDAILDPFNWAEFYAGPPLPDPRPARPERLFVILETSDNQHSRLPQIPAAKVMASHGELVYQWPEGRPREEAQVVVYAVPGEKLPR
jgi:4-amino-4-deoxy-L-arabinose transferase-like glycosyltransferase